MARYSFTFKRCLSLAIGLAALAGSVSAPTASADEIRLGAHVSVDHLRAPAVAEVMDDFTAAAGGAPEIVLNYKGPMEPLLTETEVANLVNRGQTPMVTWELYQGTWGGAPMTLEDIAAGEYDEYFENAAELAKTLPFDELMIRFAHEMNGDWYSWSGRPEAYVRAWRHVVEIFRSRGADNVKWVWSPNVEYNNYPFAEYFPGDAWVDYVALDGYNWGDSGVGVGRWQSLYSVFADSYDHITRLSSKPVIFAETASSEIGGDKAAWIRTGFLRTIPNRFPRVDAVIWFDYDKEQDWRVNSSPASLQAFRDVVASPLYGGEGQMPVVKPRVQRLRVSPQKIVLRGWKAKRASSRKIVAKYRLSKAARVRVTVRRTGRESPVLQRARGERQRGRMVLGRARSLRPGPYRATVTAYEGGQPVSARHARFRIAKKSRR